MAGLLMLRDTLMQIHMIPGLSYVMHLFLSIYTSPLTYVRARKAMPLSTASKM